MNDVKKIFTPLTTVKGSVATTILWFHLIAFILSWTFLVPTHSFFPNLGEVVSAWGTLWNNGLFHHIAATLKLCGAATVISIIFSCLVSYASTIPFFKPISFAFTRLRYNPIQGFTLFLTMTTGGGRNLQITLLVIFMSFYFITALMAIIRDIPEEDFIRREAQKMNKWKILWKVVILDRIDYLIEVIRVNLSITFMMIVSVEAMDKSQGGLGALLVDTNRALAFPKIFALQLTILMIGIGLDMLLKSIFKSFPSNRKNA
jgi:ABC-type nitrate/sulfonate/bicarbonate transport system permease component